MPAATMPSATMPAAATRFQRADWLICAAIVIATCCAYWSVLHFGFVARDDGYYVYKNAHLGESFSLRTLQWIFLSFSPDYWFPMTRLSLMLDYRLFGLRANFYHAENLLLHCGASVFLYSFLRRATGALWPPAFVAMVFGLHPLHVESVAWVAERKDVLCGIFWFAALCAWLRYTEKPSPGRYLNAVLLFSLGLMAKPMIVTLPLLLLILDRWPLRRGPLKSHIVEKLPFFALAGALVPLTLLAQNGTGALQSLTRYPAALRLENALTTVAIYTADAFWPARLWAIYAYPQSLPLWQPLGAAAAILLVSAIVLRTRHSRPYLAAGWFWFLITLLPVIGIVQSGAQARADRYMYVPIAGLAILVAWGVSGEIAGKPALQRGAAALALAAGIAMLLRTSAQTQYWKDTETLLSHAIDMDSRNYDAMNAIGYSLTADPAHSGEAIGWFRRALQIRPDLADIHNNLGYALGQSRQWDEAMEEYRAALRLDPAYDRASNNLAAALMNVGRGDEAIATVEAALRLNPRLPVLQNNLGVWLLKVPGRSAEGIRHLEQAVEIDPDYADAHANLGVTLLAMPGRLDDAIAHFTEAVRIAPDNPAARLSLAEALERSPGMELEARDQREAAQRLQIKAASH